MGNIMKINSCCCCFSLETGSRMIGCIQLVVGLADAIAVGIDSRHLSSSQKNAFSTGMIFVGVISALLGMTLLLGVNKKRLSLVYTWIIISTIMMILNGVFLLIALVMSGGSAVIVLSQLIPLFLSIYFLIVVYSYYREEKSTVSIP